MWLLLSKMGKIVKKVGLENISVIQFYTNSSKVVVLSLAYHILMNNSLLFTVKKFAN